MGVKDKYHYGLQHIILDYSIDCSIEYRATINIVMIMVISLWLLLHTQK